MDIQSARDALISRVNKEIAQYERGEYWITDKVAFNMREMIKQFRKNYWGVYDEPLDPVTKKEKLWVPLTRLLVDNVRKNVDLDPKDVRFRSSNPKSTKFTELTRGYVRRWLSRKYFNHDINQAIFTSCVDGTAVWKTYVQDGQVKYHDVDLLNIYIDPTADSIQDAYRFTERVLMTKSEMNKMDWENTDEFVTEKDLEKTDGDTAVKKVGEFGDVYECWGWFPRNEILGAMGIESNDETEIQAHVVVSGFDTGKVVFHFAEENTNRDNDGNVIKPYEEAWYIKVPGRWYGIGIPETTMQLQMWINQTVNIRINKNTVAQLGLLKVRRGAKVTQQMIQNLISKGVITLADPERDLQNMRIDEAGQSSYQDEETAKAWAQDVTSVFDINLGELPASTSATGAAIQDRQARSAFTLVVESFEHFIQRWMDRHVLPNLPKQIAKENYITYYRDFDDIREVRERVASRLVMKKIGEMKKMGFVPTEQQVIAELERVNARLEKNGDLLLKTAKDIITKGFDTEVFVTNTETDIGVTVRNLLELRNGVPPQAAAEMTAEALDLLGIKVPPSLRQPITPQGTPEVVESSQLPQVTEQTEVTNANTMNSEQR